MDLTLLDGFCHRVLESQIVGIDTSISVCLERSGCPADGATFRRSSSIRPRDVTLRPIGVVRIERSPARFVDTIQLKCGLPVILRTPDSAIIADVESVREAPERRLTLVA